MPFMLAKVQFIFHFMKHACVRTRRVVALHKVRYVATLDISFWVGPQVSVLELDGRFAEIAEANFTGYLRFNGNSHSPYRPNATRVAVEIELCDKHGLKW